MSGSCPLHFKKKRKKKNMKPIQMKPMEEWMQDRVDMIDAWISLRLEEHEEVDELLVAERELLETMLRIITQ